MKQCLNCGAGLKPGAVRCVKCGSVMEVVAALSAAALPAAATTQLVYVERADAPSAGIAFLLSFGLPGLGQLYCGRLGRGIAFFVATLIAWPLSWCALGWVAHLVAALDAARLASQKGKGARS